MRPIVTKPELPPLPHHSQQLTTELAQEPYFVIVTGRSDGRHDAAAEQRAAGPDECDIQPPLTGSLPHPSAATPGAAGRDAGIKGRWPL